MRLADLGPEAARSRLRSPSGLRIRTGPFNVGIRSPLPEVERAVTSLYAAYEVPDETAFTDFQVGVHRPLGPRGLWRPQVVFDFEGQNPFNPLPGDQGFPLLEWGLNWCVYGNCHQYLILHAAVLERGGRALVLPAPSGSGKSTLCAALALSGWRLLSDELTLISPADARVAPNPRPVSLKNESIEVIRRFAPQVRFGSQVAETAKGVVAHFAAPTGAVHAADQAVPVGWIVLPRYVSGMPATLDPIERGHAFMALIENAFNYDIFGLEGFRLLDSVVSGAQAFTFEYGDIHEVVARFDRLAAG